MGDSYLCNQDVIGLVLLHYTIYYNHMFCYLIVLFLKQIIIDFFKCKIHRARTRRYIFQFSYNDQFSLSSFFNFLITINILPQFVEWLLGSGGRPGCVARIQIVLLPLPVLGVLLEVLGNRRSDARVKLFQLFGFALKASVFLGRDLIGSRIIACTRDSNTHCCSSPFLTLPFGLPFSTFSSSSSEAGTPL